MEGEFRHWGRVYVAVVVYTVVVIAGLLAFSRRFE